MNVSFFGRMVNDPEVKQTAGGTDYAVFKVATKVRAKENNEYRTLFVNVTAYGNGLSETISKYFGKGDRIAVDGIVNDINVRESNNGRTYQNIYVDMTDFSFVESRNEKQNQNYNRPSQNQSRSQQNYNRSPQPSYNAPPPVQYSDEHGDEPSW